MNLAFWKAAVEASGDPAFGLVAAEHMTPNSMHVLTYAVLASDSIKDGIQRICRFSQMISTGTRIELEDRERITRFASSLLTVPDLRHPDGCRHGVPPANRTVSGRRLARVPLAVRLRRPPSPSPENYTKTFGVAVSFSCEHSEMDIAKRDAEAQAPFANKEVARASDAIVEGYLAQLDRDAFAFRVRQAIVERLPSGDVQEPPHREPARPERARSSAPTLREKTSFHALLEESREALARGYLEEGRWSVSEIGYRLGFSEVSAFSRAFKR